MKVSIVPGTKTSGLVFKKELHTVTFSAQMSEEEKAIVNHAKLKKEPVLQAPIKPNFSLDLNVESFMDGTEWTCTFERADYAQQFTEILKSSLQNMKAYIDSIDQKPQAETFEL